MRANQSPIALPVIFVKKLKKELRFCMDYRALNNILIKNRYPLSLILKTLNKLSKTVIFIKLDIILVFNRIE